MSNADLIRMLGYGVSTVSVGLLGAVTWHAARNDPTMRWALIGGMMTSLAGMALRWASHRAKKNPEE